MMMLSSCSPSFQEGPRTPSSSSPYRPHTSSPLSESFSPSPSTSAAAKLQSRRLAQYKSTTTATPTRRVSSAYHSRPTTDEPDFFGFGVRLFHSVDDVENNPRNALLRDRLRKRCASHRAQQVRTKKRVERERRRNGLSSDGEEMSVESDEEGENDEEEVVLNDELFRRIIASAKHKQQYSYRLSFQDEVGSSLDPDMEDVAEWERSLQEGGPLTPGEPDLPRSEFDEEEIAERAAQAEEAEFWADLVAAEEIFSTSDIDDINPKFQAIPDEDVDMA